MRLILLLACLANPVHAWEFTPEPICTIRNDAALSVEITFDGTLYAIHLTRDAGWPEAAVFSLRFEGAAGLTISTNRHIVDGARLTVTDKGFGNVLNGMQFNAAATALIGDLAVGIDLDGAAPAVMQFRDCPVFPLA